jgi:hypothetical protein
LCGTGLVEALAERFPCPKLCALFGEPMLLPLCRPADPPSDSDEMDSAPALRGECSGVGGRVPERLPVRLLLVDPTAFVGRMASGVERLRKSSRSAAT